MSLISDERADPAAGRAWGVAGLLMAVSDAVQARLGSVSVQGEISGFSRAASGHCYFSLKDADGQAALLRCAMFRRAAAMLPFAAADGQKVLVRGRLSVYEARGELQLVVEAMQRLGEGSLYELFVRLRARLQDLGLFDAQRKRPIPRYPKAVGVITSPDAAAWHDVMTAIARRAPHVRVVLYPTLVQGPQAPASVVAALALAGGRAEVDTLILCRGGGSLEDLWAFNDEQVVRAVAASPIPLVCGVGHETDVSLADLAADLRAPTPTAAAELCTPVRTDELQRLEQFERRSRHAASRRLDQHAQHLDRLAVRLGRPARALAPQSQRLANWATRLQACVDRACQLRRMHVDALGQRLPTSAQRAIDRRQQSLLAIEGRMQALDPQSVLARGYAWLTDNDGRAVTSVQKLAPGVRLVARLHDGQADLAVERVHAHTPIPDGGWPTTPHPAGK